MNIKSLLLGSAAALAVVSGAQAADAVVAAEPELEPAKWRWGVRHRAGKSAPQGAGPSVGRRVDHAPLRLMSADSRMKRSARPWTTRSIARPRRSDVVARAGSVLTRSGRSGRKMSIKVW